MKATFKVSDKSMINFFKACAKYNLLEGDSPKEFVIDLAKASVFKELHKFEVVNTFIEAKKSEGWAFWFWQANERRGYNLDGVLPVFSLESPQPYATRKNGRWYYALNEQYYDTVPTMCSVYGVVGNFY